MHELKSIFTNNSITTTLEIPAFFDASTIKISKLYNLSCGNNRTEFRNFEKELLKMVSILGLSNVIGISLLTVASQLNMIYLMTSMTAAILITLGFHGEFNLRTFSLISGSMLSYFVITTILQNPLALSMIGFSALIPITASALFITKIISDLTEKNKAALVLKQFMQNALEVPPREKNILNTCNRKFREAYTFIQHLRNPSVNSKDMQDLLETKDPQSIEIANLHSDISSIDQKNQTIVSYLKLMTILSGLTILSTVMITASNTPSLVLKSLVPLVTFYCKPYVGSYLHKLTDIMTAITSLFAVKASAIAIFTNPLTCSFIGFNSIFLLVTATVLISKAVQNINEKQDKTSQFLELSRMREA